MLLGLFTVALHSYLILVTKRKQVAQIFQSPIYVISGVTIIPLSTHAEAKLVLENTKSSVTEETNDQDSDASDSDIDNENNSAAVPEQEGDPITPSDESQARLSHNRSKDSIAQNVISKKGAYGRFAEKWFSKKGCNSEKQKSQGLSKSVDLAPDLQPTAIGSGNLFGSAQSLINQKSPNDPVPEDSALGASTISDTPNVAVALLPKLLRTTRLLLNSQSFYYSYDHDLTRRLGSIEIRTSDVPLYKQVDSQVCDHCDN